MKYSEVKRQTGTITMDDSDFNVGHTGITSFDDNPYFETNKGYLIRIIKIDEDHLLVIDVKTGINVSRELSSVIDANRTPFIVPVYDVNVKYSVNTNKVG